MNLLSKKSKDLVILFLMLLVFLFIYTFVGYEKHLHFQTFGWDTAVFDQELYFAKDLRTPYSSLLGYNGLGDHFQLVFLIFGGIFYRIWSNAFMLFFMQALFGVASAIPLYYLSKELLSKTKLSVNAVWVLSLALCFSYLFSVSFQSLMFDEFHNEPLVTLPITLMFWALFKKKNFWYWISFVAVILTKEIFGVLGVPLGLYIWIVQKDFKKALASAVLGVLTFYILIFHLMPALSHSGLYQHFSAGNTPAYIAQKFEQKPYLLVTNMVDEKAKRQTILSGLLSFGFLPILSPVNLILPASSLAIRFYDDSTPRQWEFNNHYAAPFIPLMAIASVFGLFWLTKRLDKFKSLWIYLTILLIVSALFQDVLFHGPMNSLLKKQFYMSQGWEKDDYELINQVPKNAIIATQNSLLPHLSERDNFYLLPNIGNSEYVVVDLADGPNKFSPLNYEQFKSLVNNLIEQKKFQVIWQKNQSMLLKRI